MLMSLELFNQLAAGTRAELAAHPTLCLFTVVTACVLFGIYMMSGPRRVR